MTGAEREPDALVEAMAETLWVEDALDSPLATVDWARSAWADMGGSEPTEERVAYEMRARALLAGPVGAALAEARREAWDEGYASGYDQHTGLSADDGSNPYRPTCTCQWVIDPAACVPASSAVPIRNSRGCEVHGG